VSAQPAERSGDLTPASTGEVRVPALSAWWVLIAGLSGLFASMTLTVEKIKILLNPSYVPSCNINPIVSCGSVMVTPQASVLGFPNPLLGIVGFTVVVVTGVLAVAKVPLPRWYWIGLAAGILMGAVFVQKAIYDAFMQGPPNAVEFFHGYTYSANPVACAAALATLDIYRDEKLFERARALEPKWTDAILSLKNEPNVVDIRSVGLTAGIDLTSRPDQPGKRGFDALNSAFFDNDLMMRTAGDTLALTPPLIISEEQIGEIVDKVAKVIRAVA